LSTEATNKERTTREVLLLPERLGTKMANWEALRRHIKSNYKITDDQLDMLALLFDVGDGRTQIVFVRKMMLGDLEWAEITTPVCTEADITPRDALLRNSDLVVGGLALMDTGTVMFRHSLPLKDLDVDEFEVPFHVIINFGDRLEQELAVVDRF
jgi:hypothetical protein